MRVGVVGGGFGRGLAAVVARAGHEVALCSRRSLDDDAGGLICSVDLREVFAEELIFLAVPSEHLDWLLGELVGLVDGRHRLVHVSRGLIGSELQTVCQALVERTSARRVGVLAGPLSRGVLHEGNPGGAIVGSDYPEVIDAVREVLGGPKLRIYGTEDRQGVEVCAALTGVLLFALGFGKGMGFGPSTLGLLAARGMAELLRINRALGGRGETMSGLAGFGDLMAAIAGDGRPEWELGSAMARGASAGQALKALQGNVEGTRVIDHLCGFGATRGIELPLVEGLARVLRGEESGADAVSRLMSRDVRDEGLR